MSIYKVRKLINNNIQVHVPGSKSITNRALLLAALGIGTSVIKGALCSEDSEYFLKCLGNLGFHIEELNDKIIIEGNSGDIPSKEAEIYVGSAGTAARFLTSMLALSDGEYIIRASEQMSRRPMRDLLEALETMGAQFTYLGEPYSLPLRVIGVLNKRLRDTQKNSCKSTKVKCEYNINLNIDKSSQYLSALLMTAPMLKSPVKIKLTGKRTALSYVDITIKMMSAFGVDVICDSQGSYMVSGSSEYKACEYRCEPDVSAACYYYAMAAMTGGSALVYGVFRNSLQGDIRFIDVLESMGCQVSEESNGVIVGGPKIGELKGIDIDMSDFSDQTMTLAAISPFANSDVIIRNVGHIRSQESDRLTAVKTELKRMKIECETWDDGIIIHPGSPSPATIETYNDHRIAMAFAITGLMAEGIRISNYECCRKTFPNYFEILDSLTKDA